MNPEPERKPFKCRHCQKHLCDRRDNTIIAFGFEFDLKRTHNIKCLGCGVTTKFGIDQKGEKGVILNSV